MSGPRTSHAGREPCVALAALGGDVGVALAARDSASGAANGGSGSPASMPREPGASVRSVLSVM